MLVVIIIDILLVATLPTYRYDLPTENLVQVVLWVFPRKILPTFSPGEEAVKGDACSDKDIEGERISR